MMIDRDIEKKVATAVTIITVIWGVLVLLLLTGAIAPSGSSYDEIKSYYSFMSKTISCAIPIAIACLALVPVINEDMKLISYISYAIAIISLFIFLFTDGITSEILDSVLYIDILILIVCTVRTTSPVHRMFKYILFILIIITIIVFNTNVGNLSLLMMVDLTSEAGVSNLLSVLIMFTFIGFFLNPCIGLITEDDAYSVGYGGNSNGTSNGRRENESPLEMYNRLLAEQALAGNPGSAAAPAEPTAPVAESTPAPQPATPPIGPNSGAVINPLAARPAPAPTPAPAPEQAAQSQENFEVPASMAFLFDDNQDKSN